MTMNIKWEEAEAGDLENRPIQIVEKKMVESTQRVTIKGLKGRIADCDRQIEQIKQQKALMADQIKEIEKALGIQSK